MVGNNGANNVFEVGRVGLFIEVFSKEGPTSGTSDGVHGIVFMVWLVRHY